MKNYLLLICLLVILPREILPQYQNRNHYQNRLEPINSILHGAGQDGGQLATLEKDAFDNYSSVMPNNGKPMVYMYYEGLRNIGSNWASKLKNDLLAYGDSLIVIQFGLELVGQTEIIPTGALDDDIEDLLNGIEELGLPVYLRIGYEFNGLSWNGYLPGPYRASFVYITQKIRQRDLEVATVWNFVPEITQPLDFMSYYPGDTWVDWWAINFFSVYQIDHPATIAFLDSANARQKPIAIGESTPRYIGVDNGQQSWNAWFSPLFSRIATEPGIKMTGYINWDWSLFPEWSTWGDARIEQNAIISQNMISEMANPMYLSLGKDRSFREALGYTEIVSPPKISSITVQDTAYPAEISWDAVTDISGISRYLIYKNGEFWDFTGLTELTLLRGEPGEQIQLAVQAVDRAGNRAPLSDPVLVTVPQPPDSSELIQNGDFNNGTSFWNLREYVGNVNANVTIDNNGILNGANSAKITVSQNTGTNWHIQFQQGLQLKAGHQYAIRYQARASQQTTMETWLQQDHEPWFGYAVSTVTLTENPAIFEDLSVVVDQDDTVFFTFMLGTSGLVDVWVDSISVIDLGAVNSITDAEQVPIENFNLLPAYPNPFNPTVTIRFNLPAPGEYKAEILNTLGQVVYSTSEKVSQKGFQSMNWNGQGYSSGIYLVRVIFQGHERVQRIVLLK